MQRRENFGKIWHLKCASYLEPCPKAFYATKCSTEMEISTINNDGTRILQTHINLHCLLAADTSIIARNQSAICNVNVNIDEKIIIQTHGHSLSLVATDKNMNKVLTYGINKISIKVTQIDAKRDCYSIN